MHLKDAELRTYLDGELPELERQQVIDHLAGCAECRRAVQVLETRQQRLSAHLASLEPQRTHPLAPKAARRRLEERLQAAEKERIPMFRQLTNKLSRPAWAAITLVAVLAISLAFPSVRAAANSLLRLFRVEQFQVLTVDVENQQLGQIGSSESLEMMFSKNVKVERNGEKSQPVASAAEAAQFAGFPVRLPTGLGEPAGLYVEQGGKISFQLDLELARAVLKDMNRTDIVLPDSLHGQAIEITQSKDVVALYGDCPKPGEKPELGDPDDIANVEPSNCTSFVQMPSPVISAPDDLDIARLGEIYLQLLGLDSNEAASFARNVDWASTLVIPVPSLGSNYRDVTVDGVPGVFIRYTKRGPLYLLMWVKDGFVYALMGPGGSDLALDIANSLK